MLVGFSRQASQKSLQALDINPEPDTIQEKPPCTMETRPMVRRGQNRTLGYEAPKIRTKVCLKNKRR